MSSESQIAESQNLMREAITTIAVGPNRGRDITQDHAKQICEAILAGHIDDVQIGIFLIALRMKRESAAEFGGLLEGLHSEISIQSVNVANLLCLADPFDGYSRFASITPFIPPVLAACGVPCAIHGVRQSGPKKGVTAHQVYELAGMATGDSAEQAAENISNVAWAYLDQSVYAPSLYALQPLREKIVKRTALTTLERVLMPLRAQGHTHMVMGFVHSAYPDIYAALARQAGYHTALLLKGVEGGLAPALNKPVRSWFYSAEVQDPASQIKQKFELPEALSDSMAALKSDQVSAEQCLTAGLECLKGRQTLGYKSLTVATAKILYHYGQSNSFAAAVEKVQNSLDNGSAEACFKQLVQNA